VRIAELRKSQWCSQPTQTGSHGIEGRRRRLCTRLYGVQERVIYDRYHVAIVGFIPLRTESGESKLTFQIEGKIDIVAIRSNASRRAARPKEQFSYYIWLEPYV
jgi:hypothetical protein